MSSYSCCSPSSIHWCLIVSARYILLIINPYPLQEMRISMAMGVTAAADSCLEFAVTGHNFQGYVSRLCFSSLSLRGEQRDTTTTTGCYLFGSSGILGAVRNTGATQPWTCPNNEKGCCYAAEALQPTHSYKEDSLTEGSFVLSRPH